MTELCFINVPADIPCSQLLPSLTKNRVSHTPLRRRPSLHHRRWLAGLHQEVNPQLQERKEMDIFQGLELIIIVVAVVVVVVVLIKLYP